MNMSIKYYLIRFVIFSTMAYIVICLFLFMNQRNFIYFPNDQDFNTCPGFADSETVNFAGTRMYYLESEGSETILVYYHGNAGSACDRSFIKDILKDHGISLLFVEYSGYSADIRKPTRDLILQDAKNAKAFIDQMGYERLFLIGNSLGSAVASYHQTLQTPERIVLLSPFDKLSNVGKIHYPFLPVDLIMREEYDPDDWIKDYVGKILIIHGLEDEIIPIKLAERLYDLIASEEKEFVAVKRADHNSLLAKPEVWEKVIDFLELEDQ